MKLLIGSPVRQKPKILHEFLLGLDAADQSGLLVSYCFVDDNTDSTSSELLSQFAESHDCQIFRGAELSGKAQLDRYDCDEVTHNWDMTAIHKIAFFKDTIIEYAISEGFDALFFVDSDIVIDRRTLLHLLSKNVEIVSNVFWTQWQPGWDLEPQCFWMPDLAMQTKSPFAPPMPLDEARQLRLDYFAKMRVPGLYRVDGLGACTMILRSALEKGVRFRAIPNLSLMGEDRHFCIRAGALDIPLYFDTVYPVYHIYREEYLDRVAEFKQSGFRYDMCQSDSANYDALSDSGANQSVKNLLAHFYRKCKAVLTGQKAPLRFTDPKSTITALIAVDDRSVKYLNTALHSVTEAADRFLIWDSTTGSDVSAICTAQLDGKSWRILRRSGTPSSNPFQNLWAALEEAPTGWVLALFADEVLPNTAAFAIRHLTENNGIHAYFFRRYEMWDDSHFRQDDLWPIYPASLPYLMRYQPGYEYQWSADATGASRKFPSEVWRVRRARIDLQIQNYHWADSADRQHDFESGALFGRGDAGTRKCRLTSLQDENPALVSYDMLPKAFPHPMQPVDREEVPDD